MTDDHEQSTNVPRRTFMKGIGLAAGAGLLGAGVGGTAVAAEADDGSSIDPRFLNWRRVEAKKVWDRGFRGRPDRTVGLADSGVDARHPEIGPWNGARAEILKDQVAIPTSDSGGQEKSALTDENGEQKGESFSGVILPGTVVGPTQQRNVHEFQTPPGAENVEAEMDGTPNGPLGLGSDNELYLEKGIDTDGDGQVDEWLRVGVSTNAGSVESIDAFVEGDHPYRFVVESWISGPYSYTIEAGYFEFESELITLTGEEAREAWIYGDEDAGIEGVSGELAPETPKVVGWNGGHDEPLDGNGHGSHVSGIMAGSGRGSALDRAEVHEPRAVLAPTEFLEYEVEAEAGTNVFASAFGDNVELFIVGPDGRELHHTPMQADSIVADEPTHDDAYHADGGSATYTVRVEPWETRSATEDVANQPQEGNPSAGRLERIAVGTYEDQFSTVGERTGDPADVPDESLLGRSVHPGVAPNQSILGVQGLSNATKLLGRYSEGFAEVFNTRAVNMSWGWVGGAPLGVAGGDTDSGVSASIKSMADGGILPVSAAGNTFTPANSGSPATADEAISVVATGPLDGITSYSSGGVAAVDEDEDDAYGKPDLTAPGGDAEPDGLVNIAMAIAENEAEGLTGEDLPISYPLPSTLELVRSVRAGDPDADLPAREPRDYDDAGGTSMASPYVTGVAALVAQAMEEAAPDRIALPEPRATDIDDIMRFKQVLLATASETAFTAAPYHSGKLVPNAPTYDFGDRDPWEGYGRVNPDAAVDAVTRPYVADADVVPRSPVVDAGALDPDETASATVQETVGLGLPEHSRAVAGYLDVDGGSAAVSVEFSHYSGGNRGMAKGAPHVDLFVYDGADPADHGEPNIVASDQGLEGSPSVSVSGEGTYLVVAKLVNVPGAVNGFDIQAHLDLGLTYTAPSLPSFSASGTREDDGHAVTQGGTHSVDVTVDSFSEGVTEVSISDRIPGGWTLQPFADAPNEDPIEGPTTVDLVGNVSRDDLGTDEAARTYIVEATGDTGGYEFGPAEATIESTEDDAAFENDTAELVGTETNVIVGVDQNDPAGSAADGASSAVEGSSPTDDVTDTVEDTL